MLQGRALWMWWHWKERQETHISFLPCAHINCIPGFKMAVSTWWWWHGLRSLLGRGPLLSSTRWQAGLWYWVSPMAPGYSFPGRCVPSLWLPALDNLASAAPLEFGVDIWIEGSTHTMPSGVYVLTCLTHTILWSRSCYSSCVTGEKLRYREAV